MKYPQYNEELLAMGEEDQHELRNMNRLMDEMETDEERTKYRQSLSDHSYARTKKMFEILDVIGIPTFDKISEEAASIVSLLVLHSNVDDMKRVLAMYEEQFKIDPNSFYKGAIPPLTDRIMITEQRKQKFGTNWSITKKREWFLVPIVDFDNVNELRAEYGLDPIRKPHCLAIGWEEWPLGQGPAEKSDQKELTDEEYAEYTGLTTRKK